MTSTVCLGGRCQVKNLGAKPVLSVAWGALHIFIVFQNLKKPEDCTLIEFKVFRKFAVRLREEVDSANSQS